MSEPFLPPLSATGREQRHCSVFLSVVHLLAQDGCSLKAGPATEGLATPHPLLPVGNRKGLMLLGFVLEREPAPEL